MAYGPPQPENAHQSLWSRTWDAITWAVSALIANTTDFPHLWRNAAPRERITLVVTAGWLVVLTLAVAVTPLPWWFWMIPVGFLIQLVADLSDIAERVHERARLNRLLASQPTGAPRVANVRCTNGCSHRFIYGLGGWEEAGPAELVSTFPAGEEIQHG